MRYEIHLEGYDKQPIEGVQLTWEGERRPDMVRLGDGSPYHFHRYRLPNDPKQFGTAVVYRPGSLVEFNDIHPALDNRKKLVLVEL